MFSIALLSFLYCFSYCGFSSSTYILMQCTDSKENFFLSRNLVESTQLNGQSSITKYGWGVFCRDFSFSCTVRYLRTSSVHNFFCSINYFMTLSPNFIKNIKYQKHNKNYFLSLNDPECFVLSSKVYASEHFQSSGFVFSFVLRTDDNPR